MLCVDMSDQLLALCFGDAKENAPSLAVHGIASEYGNLVIDEIRLPYIAT